MGKPRWVIHFIAAATIVLFLILATGSASAATICGKITDTYGVNVAGAIVTIYQDGTEYVFADNPGMTNINGYYEFAGLPDGTYSIQADKGGYSSPSDSVTLTGSDMQIDLQIPGYDSTAVAPTAPPVYVTPRPTPAPPTPTPTPRPSPTILPLPPSEPEPGFGLLLALISIGAVAAIRRFR